MSQAPSLPLFCDAYLADTMHLSLEEHGAYLKLLMITWRNNGQPLPDENERMARMLGVTLGRWRDRLRPALAPFFDLSDGTWRQKRLEKEWAYVMRRAAIARENGTKGARLKGLADKDDAQPAGGPDAAREGDSQPQAQPQTQPHDQVPDARLVDVWERLIALLRVPASRRGQYAMAPVGAWLAAGADPDRHILPVVARVLAKRGAKAAPRTLAYFDEPVREALGCADAGAAPLPSRDSEWEHRVRHYDPSRPHLWGAFNGPPPDQPGCHAPRSLLERHGYRPKSGAPRPAEKDRS